MAVRSVEAAIELALFRHIELFPIPNFPIAFPNKPFEPHKMAAGVPRFPESRMWFRVMLMPNRTFAAGCGEAAWNRHFGLLQVDVMDRAGVGSSASRDMAGMVIDHCRRGTKLTIGDGMVIRLGMQPNGDGTPYAVAPIKLDGWLQTPVTIPYLVDAPNT